MNTIGVIDAGQMGAGIAQVSAQAGYRALCLTVDAPLVGRRERDMRNRFGLPHGMGWKNLEGVGLERMDVGAEGSALSHYISNIWDSALTWEAIAWLRSFIVADPK